MTARGGHIDTPFPEGQITRQKPRPRIDTPDPAHETPPPAPPSPEPQFWQLRQRANPYFMGRERVLQELHEQFQHQHLCHLHGPLGSGTTQSALAYAFRARGGFDAVFWIDAKNGLSLRFDLSQAIDDLGLPTHDELGHQARLDAILAWLNTHERWLLIADGITDYATLQALLPTRPRGKILLTGPADLGQPSIHVVNHGPLEDAAACQFLEHRSQQPGAAGLKKLVARFGGSTLPLYLAGAFCHSAGVTLADYDARMAQSLGTMNHVSENARPLAILRAVVEQSLHYVSKQNPTALELMALCAHLDSETIPLVTLYDGAPFLPKRLSACVTNSRALHRSLSLLYRLGLIQFEQNSVTIHPHIQHATRYLLGKEQGDAWIMTALRVVLEAFPVEAHYKHPIPQCSMLVPHALAITRLSGQAENLREGTAALLNHVGLYLHACDEIEVARTCIEKSIALAEALYGTSVHPTVASRTNSLGVILQDQERYGEARDCYQRAFELCEEIYGPACDAVLGPAHRSMLTMPSRNLCQVFELMGDIPAAKTAYENAIDTFIEIYAWNHPLVAASMNGLGQLHRKTGELRLAQQCFLKAIQAEEHAEKSALGVLSRYTRNLALCLTETGKIEEAQKFYEHTLICDREDFGNVHERVASGLQGLARCHRARSRFDQAHQCLDDALAIWNTLDEGPGSAKANIWRQKGRCYRDSNDYEKAVACLQKALVTTETTAGATCSVLGPDYIYLGRTLGRLERHAEAEKCFLKALQLHEAKSWLNDKDLIVLYTRLVRVCRTQQEFVRGSDYQKRLLELKQRLFGSTEERVGADAYSLGNLYIASGNIDEAKRYLQMSLDIYTDSRGPDNELTARVRRKLDTVEYLELRDS
jgi:tetratricopeptide (TPR) repeat protein